MSYVGPQSSDKVTISKEEIDARLRDVQVSKCDLNRLVMDYLVIEGYKAAAEEFSQEANVEPPVDLEYIESRKVIRDALQRGDVQDAITRVNDMNPDDSNCSCTTLRPLEVEEDISEPSVFNMIITTRRLVVSTQLLLKAYCQILDTNPTLYFHLQQQKMIEYIRRGEIAEALKFAQDELAPRGEESPEFLSELEQTMALLAFDPTSASASGSDISDLLSPAQRLKTASEVNAAILESLGQRNEIKLASLLKMLCWGEAMMEERANFTKVDLSDGLMTNVPSSD